MLQTNKCKIYSSKNFHGDYPTDLHFNSSSKFDAVLFDLFDTLILINDNDLAYVKSLHKMHNFLSYNGLACSFDHFKQAYLKVSDRINMETSCTLEEPHFSVYVERTLNELGVKLKEQTYLTLQAVEEFNKEFKCHLSVDPQAFGVLDLLHKRCKMGVISNLTFSECAWELLEDIGLKRYLDLIIVSGDINLRKPHPHIFNMALRYLGVKPSRTLFIGDTLETDIMGSRNAGLTSVHISRRPSKNTAIKPHLTIKELKQVIPIVGFEEDLEVASQ
jgi:HAD superfamily hydrolase (TIGR01549 family)